MLKKLTIIIATIAIVIVAAIFVLDKFFFKSGDDILPQISNFQENNFDFKISKSFYFKIEKKLYFSPDGRLSYDTKCIWNENVEEVFVAPNGKYALLFRDCKLTLIDYTGKQLYQIRNTTGLIPIEKERKNGRFISSNIQWGKNSNYFLILQDRVWYKNFSKKNKSTIYVYTIADNSFKPLVDLDEEVEECFAPNENEKDIYYQFATSKGNFAFKKVNLTTRKIAKEYFCDDSLRIKDITSDSLFYNYKIKQFDGNSFDRKSVITTAITGDGKQNGVYLYNQDTTVCLIKGVWGLNAFKGTHTDFFDGGYFLPGNRFFVVKISSKNFSGQVIGDNQTFKTMKLKKNVQFYFNINTRDCGDFVFRYEIDPKIQFASSVGLKIEEKNKFH